MCNFEASDISENLLLSSLEIKAPRQRDESYFSPYGYSLSDLKLHLQSTDYGNFLANVPSPLQVSVIDDKLREKLVTEFQHLRNHATGPLGIFLDFIT